MSKAVDLIKNPHIFRQLLASKYNYSKEEYDSHQIDIILYNKHARLNVLYTETILKHSNTDYIQEYYTTPESNQRISKLTEYYYSYQMFFSQPILTNWQNVLLLKNHYEKKAEVFYMSNYYSKKDNLLSYELNPYVDNDSSSMNDYTDNRTIFNSKIKDKINSVKELSIIALGNSIKAINANMKNHNDNYNPYGPNALISTISFENNNDNNSLNSSYDLYSKRSPMDSLGNIVFSFRTKYPLLMKHQQALSRQKIIKTVVHKENVKEKEASNKKTSLPSYKPPCFKSHLIEFTDNKPNLLDSITKTKKNSNLSSERPSLLLKKTNSNKTFDSKYIQMTKAKSGSKINTKPLSKQYEMHSSKGTTRNIQSNIYLSHTSNINLLKNNRTNLSHNNRTKAMANHRFSLSNCNSLTLLKQKQKIALNKKTTLLKALSINEQKQLSRNKSNGNHTSTVITKNTKSVYSHYNKINPTVMTVTTTSKTKSVDLKEKERKGLPSAFPLPLPHKCKYSLKNIFKGNNNALVTQIDKANMNANRNTKANANLKITKHITELLKQSRKVKSINAKIKFHNN